MYLVSEKDAKYIFMELKMILLNLNISLLDFLSVSKSITIDNIH